MSQQLKSDEQQMKLLDFFIEQLIILAIENFSFFTNSYVEH